MRRTNPLLHSFPLIEPYGIEIAEQRRLQPCIGTFNRTLWNWNGADAEVISARDDAFNRTLWNWNPKTSLRTPSTSSTFNRTLWNWNWYTRFGIWLTTSFNRTLWNWNFIIFLVALWCWIPLIEPYGIEMHYLSLHPLSETEPLIEPYGIEIALALRLHFNRSLVIIAPNQHLSSSNTQSTPQTRRLAYDKHTVRQWGWATSQVLLWEFVFPFY